MAAISRLTELVGRWRCSRWEPAQSLHRAKSVPYSAAMHSKTPLIACFVAATAVSWAAPAVQIFTDPPSPQPVGTVIGISVAGKDEGEPEKYLPLLRYRFSIA